MMRSVVVLLCHFCSLVERERGGDWREREREREGEGERKANYFPISHSEADNVQKFASKFFLKVKSEKETKNCEPELKRVWINQHIHFPPNVFRFLLPARLQ